MKSLEDCKNCEKHKEIQTLLVGCQRDGYTGFAPIHEKEKGTYVVDCFDE